MPHYKINHTALPELLKEDIPVFKAFMSKEFSGYLNEDGSFYAHNDGDSHWFTQQFLEAKKDKGIYADFFKKKRKASTV